MSVHVVDHLENMITLSHTKVHHVLAKLSSSGTKTHVKISNTHKNV